MVTLVSKLQPWNALSPMLATLSEIVTLVRFVQLLNALYPMSVTASPISIDKMDSGFWIEFCSSVPLMSRNYFTYPLPEVYVMVV